VLIGIGLTHSLLAEWQIAAGLPYALALPAAAGTYVLSERVSARRAASRNTYLAALFAALLGLSALVSTLFPILESRMAQRFFGDLATLADTEAEMLIALGAALIAGLVMARRPLMRSAFRRQVLGEGPGNSGAPSEFWLGVATLTAVCYGVQTAGLLFTLGTLFLPTALLAAGKRRGHAFHLTAAALTAGIGAGCGFLAALAVPRVATVPMVLLGVGVAAAAVSRVPARR
jgi:ABC-type Mn2+/Zn2+ transport system permease subunit